MQHHLSPLTWIRPRCSQGFLLLPPSHGCLYLRYPQHDSFTFSYKDSPCESPHTVRSSIRTYPSFVSSRALSACLSAQTSHLVFTELSTSHIHFSKCNLLPVHNNHFNRSNRHFHELFVNEKQILVLFSNP